MNSDELRALSFATMDDGEELARAEIYGLLARLWFAPPDDELRAARISSACALEIVNDFVTCAHVPPLLRFIVPSSTPSTKQSKIAQSQQ